MSIEVRVSTSDSPYRTCTNVFSKHILCTESLQSVDIFLEYRVSVFLALSLSLLRTLCEAFH